MGLSIRKWKTMRRRSVLQRDQLINKNKFQGETLNIEDVQFQRPCPENAISVNDITKF